MSVMILEKDMFVRIGKYLSLSYGDEQVVKLLKGFLELNQQNYAVRYKEEFSGVPTYQFSDVTFSFEPIPSAVQVHSDIGRLIYNCIDYGDEINPSLIEYLESERARIERSAEYEATKRFQRHVAI